MKKTALFFFAVLFAAVASAQRPVVADKIVGIVGDKIILKSDVYNDIQDRQRRNEPVPPNAECFIMEQILALKALVLQAEKDSIIIEDAEIESLLDNQVRGFIGQYGSKEALEEIAGRTVYQIKEDLRQSFKERKLAERMRDKIVEGVKITPQEAKAYWEKIPKDSLPFYESEVEIGEIVLYPKASRDLEKLAQDELLDYKQQVESGKATFETLAGLYTDDPGSKNTGGRYTTNRAEKTIEGQPADPAFVNNAFRLKEKQISPVFKSRFGYHIILMVSRAGDDAVVRHILRVPKVTESEVTAAMQRLDSIRSKLVAATLTFGAAAERYSEDDNAKFTAGMLQGQNGTYLTYDQLSKDMALLIKDMKVGEISKPVAFTDERGKKGVRIAFLKSRSEPHRENLKDDYNRIAQRAVEFKKQEMIEKWFTTKISNYYLMIDPEFANCETLSPWLKYAAKSGF
ncbi:peptidylprolyl isomerase [Flavitalea sp.]|nr:peptidylprolyl isomerase [Flavitalea sp.]